MNFFSHPVKATIMYSLLLMLGCSKESQNPAQTTLDIYIAGYEVNSNGISVAKYWKNGAVTEVSDGSLNAVLNSIALDNTDVYVVGHEYCSAGTPIPKLWKNSSAVNLVDAVQCHTSSSISTYGDAYDLIVANASVYVAGYEYTTDPSNSGYFATYWKDGAKSHLSSGASEAMAYSIDVSGADIHVVGYEINGNGIKVARYWKNGVGTDLTDGTLNAVAHDIKVNGNDIYIVGKEGTASGYSVPVIWKNGVKTELVSNPIGQNDAFSLAISNGAVYVAGYSSAPPSGKWTASYWKDGSLSYLSATTSNYWATGIAVSNGDVYAVGFQDYSKGTAKFWKRGVEIDLTKGATDARANAIVLK